MNKQDLRRIADAIAATYPDHAETLRAMTIETERERCERIGAAMMVTLEPFTGPLRRPADELGYPVKVRLPLSAVTEEDALRAIEMVDTNGPGLLACCNATRYRGTVWPLEVLETADEAKHGAPDTIGHAFARVDQFHVCVSAFVRIGEDIARLDFEIEKPSIRATARRVDYKGGFRYADKRLSDPNNLFPLARIRTWSSDETTGSWTLIA